MRIALIAAAMLGAMAPAQAQTSTQARDFGLGWLVGSWATDTDAKGQQTLERWVATEHGLNGVGESRAADKVAPGEKMRIRLAKTGAVFLASPDGQPATSFTEVSRGASEIVFENRTHDYPQRIRYWREGERLLAEISLADGSKPMRWTYCRVTGDTMVKKPCG